MRQVVLYPGEDGYWVVECPSLPACISQGRTKEEAIANIKEAIEGNIAALQDDNLAVPDHSELDRGTLHGIRQAGLSTDEFVELL
jgi:predicted RNase H-like HicB family nuclease